jgi:hypothetical protein
VADRRVDQSISGVFGEGDGVMPYLRLPFAMPWPERVERARAFRADFAPDWISWQIVLYGFDRLGLCFGLGRHCRAIAGDVKNEIMFHEIWIGLGQGSSLKSRAVGALQKGIIKGLLRDLRPRAVHTHTPLYRFLLSRLGQPVALLRLFGNIPLAEPRPGWLGEQLAASGTPFSARQDWLVFVIFGTIHDAWNTADFISQAIAAAKSAGKKGLLLLVGRPGGHGEQTVRALKEMETTDFRVCALGAKPEEEISQCLFAGDFGVSTVPPEYLFKSGTAAAMIEHGLPVVTTRPSYRYPQCPPQVAHEIMPHTQRNLGMEMPSRPKPGSLLPQIARRFVEDLSRA